MGLDVYSQVYVGFLTEPGDLWIKVGEQNSCSRGHTNAAGARFCNECGERCELRALVKPTPGLQRLAELLGVSAADSDELREAGVGVNVHECTSYEDSTKIEAVVLNLCETSSSRSTSAGAKSVSMQDLEKAFSEAGRRKVALLGEGSTRAVSMFCVTYMSY